MEGKRENDKGSWALLLKGLGVLTGLVVFAGILSGTFFPFFLLAAK